MPVTKHYALTLFISAIAIVGGYLLGHSRGMNEVWLVWEWQKNNESSQEKPAACDSTPAPRQIHL